MAVTEARSKEDTPQEDSPLVSGSLAAQSATRMLSDITILILGTVTAVLTARVLGPADKGVFSTMSFVAGVAALVATLGLGDAAIVGLNRHKTPMSRVLPTTGLVVCASALAGTVLLWLLLRLFFANAWDRAATAALITACALPVSTATTVLSQVLTARGKIVLTSLNALVMAAVSTVMMAVLLLAFDASLTNAAIAGVSGGFVGLGITIWALDHDRGSLRPGWDSLYLRRALRFGAAIQVSYLVVSLTGRADLVMVYALGSENDAGIYSVALTFGVLSAYSALALAYAGFPRLANMDDDAAAVLSGKLFRIGVVTSVLIAVVLAALSPLLIPALFGASFDGAVLPAIILLAGGILFSGQMVLARARAARGTGSLLVWSFTASTGVMLALDVVAIPLLGAPGAALASVVGGAVGLVICLKRHGFSDLDLIPTKADIRVVVNAPAQLAGQLGWALRRRGAA
jgi:O-antigen/teichoic acid export membrane protein